VSEGWNQQISERPILEERVSSIQYYSLPEQVLEFEQKLTTLQKREALVLCDGWDAPRRIRTLDVVEPYARPEWLERFRLEAMAQHAFWLTLEDATARIGRSDTATEPTVLRAYGRRRTEPSATDHSDTD
jgi:hypothetical protein